MKNMKYFIFFFLTLVLFLSFKYNFNEKKIFGKTIKKTWKTYQIKGIDVSHHQGDIDWNEVKKQNVYFCFIKATEGINFVDKKFEYNYKEAKKNKILVGAYHYYRFNRNNNLQFKNFTKSVHKGSIDFPPVIDVEYFGNEKLRDLRNKEKFIKDLKSFQSMIENFYGKKPIIYTDVKFYNDLIKGKIDNLIWISDLRTEEIDYIDSSQWIFWQYSFLGKKNGIKKHVDLNVFNGDLEKLNQLKLVKTR